MVKGKVEPSACRVGGEKVTAEVCKILGTDTVAVAEKLIARLFCGGGHDKCGKKFEYHGVKTCSAATLVGDGDKLCDYGCLGYGDCVKVCKFDAMRMGEDGLPIIDPAKCTACGLCIKECPRALIQLVLKKAKIIINCSSTDKGAKVRKICKVGCIKCKLCEKKCPTKAISFPDGPLGRVLPVVDNNKCEGLKECVKVCPTKTIIEL
jgi:ferredoxin